MNDAALLSLGATGERKDVSDVNELGAIPGSGGRTWLYSILKG